MPASKIATAYTRALSTFSVSDQKAIERVLRGWARVSSLGPRVVANLRKERFLSSTDLRSLLQVFLRHSQLRQINWDSVKKDYVVACRGLSLRGGDVPRRALPKLIGRAIPPDRLINNVLDALQGKLVLRSHINDFVHDVLTSPSPIIEGDQANWPMARYASWVTWDDSASGNNPFGFAVTGEAIEVAACLGLPWSYVNPNPSLVLLVCDRPDECRLKRPTISDAADHEYFEPPDLLRGGNHGWTMPWQSPTVTSTGREVTLISRPEALHSPITFKHLRTTMLRIVK